MNKIQETLSKILKNDSKKVKVIVAVGLVGIVLIAMSSLFTPSNKEKDVSSESSIDYSSYSKETEQKLTDIISSISGVGECKVMITFETGSENVYATDSELKNDENSSDSKDEYVLYNSSNGEKALLIKEKYPTVQGVSVVCDGGDDVEVREKVINTVTSLFNISTNRVSVSKIKSKGD